MSDYGELIDLCLREDDRSALPALSPTLARALAGGAHRMIDAHLRAGRGGELGKLAPQLARWIRSHHPVPDVLFAGEPLARPWSWLEDSPGGLLGGRAPGTLTFAPDCQPHIAERSRALLQHSNRERILDAVAQLTAEQGYAQLTATAIAKRVGLSERAFLAHFKTKEDAFAAAVELGHVKGQAVVWRARAGARAWSAGVRAATYALVEFLASEPRFARLAFVDAPLAGPAMLRRTHEHLCAYARLLFDGAPQQRRPPPIAPEAIVHALVELAFHHAARGTAARLHEDSGEIAYMALAPFLGVEGAAQAAVSL